MCLQKKLFMYNQWKHVYVTINILPALHIKKKYHDDRAANDLNKK